MSTISDVYANNILFALQVKRRHRVNRDVSKIFSHIKEYGQQPGRVSCLPSSLATFTPYALRWALANLIAIRLPLCRNAYSLIEYFWFNLESKRLFEYVWLDLLLSAGHWVRKCFAQCERQIMRLPAMLVSMTAWAFWDKTQTSSYMTGL